jgi:signal peptidase
MASTGSPLARGVRRLAGVLPLLGALALGLVILVPALLGYQRYVILTGSMTGTYDRGTIVFDRVVPTASLRTGDVITFTPPGHPGLVTHRIHSIKVIQGQRVFATKGDFNKVPDVWNPMTLRGATQAKVAFSVPYAGFAIAALSERKWRMLVIGIPAALIALLTLAALWRDAEPEPEPEPSGSP